MNWWLSRGGNAEGPFPTEHVIVWLKSGQILADTFACPEGGSAWQRLGEISEFAKLVPPPPPPNVGSPGTSPIAAYPGGLQSTLPPQDSAHLPGGRYRASFSVLTAAIVLGACSLFFELISIGETWEEAGVPKVLNLLTSIAGLVTWLVFHYQLWTLVPMVYRETTPGLAVGLLFVPLYNAYWVFRSCPGVNRGLNRLAGARSGHGRQASVGLAIGYAVCVVVGLSLVLLFTLVAPEDDPDREPILNVLTLVFSSVPSFVLWLLMVLNQKRMVEHLLQTGAAVDPASGLVR